MTHRTRLPKPHSQELMFKLSQNKRKKERKQGKLETDTKMTNFPKKAEKDKVVQFFHIIFLLHPLLIVYLTLFCFASQNAHDMKTENETILYFASLFSHTIKLYIL